MDVENVIAENGNDTEKISGIVIDNKKKKLKKLVIVSFVFLVFAAVFAAYYLVGVAKYKNVFAPNTTINGVDVSCKTIEEAKALLYASTADYSLSIKFKNGEEKLSVGDGGLGIAFDTDIEEYFNAQNPHRWIFNIGATYSYKDDYSLSYDEETIKAYLDTLPEMEEANMTPSTDAVVAMTNGEVILTEDKEGTELDKDKVYSLILKSLSDKSTGVDVEAHDCYIEAELDTDSKYIQNIMEKAEKYLSVKGTYTMDGETVLEISRKALSDMACIDENGDVEIIHDKVKEYVEGIASYFPETTSGTKNVQFTTHKGTKKDIKAKSSKLVFDVEAETEALYECLQEMTDFERTPIYKATETTSGYDVVIDDTYLEIDLGEQHVYYYKKGKLIFDTLCVSGGLSSGMTTPSGLYRMGPLERNARLVGETYDTIVSYWMPFIDESIGLHDASWRSEFGGDIYKYDGSHGCINLSSQAAMTLYSLVYQGLPVVVYY